MNQYAVAHRLGMSLGEVRAWPVEDFNGWVAYFNILEARRDGP